jgi:hypothetical protein
MRRTLFLALLLVVPAAVNAQDGSNNGRLTADDYAEINQLYARYNHFLDSGKDDGLAYARLFTEDAVFETNVAGLGTLRGRAQLAALARRSSASAAVRPVHNTNSIMIDPSPEGARGSAYFTQMSAGEEGKPPVIGIRGIYTDVLVKTSEGWRFKSRSFAHATPAKPRSTPSAR